MDLITNYRELTEAIKAMTSMPAEVLHVHAGMIIYLGSQFLLGCRRASWMALSIVLEIELINELMNYLFYGSWRWVDTSCDILMTMFWPSMCVAVGKYRRWRWSQRRCFLGKDKHGVLEVHRLSVFGEGKARLYT